MWKIITVGRILSANGITDLGMAFEELTSMLSRKKFLKSPSLSYAPVIFLMTDGYPTDNYKKGLEKLKIIIGINTE